ncbi:MAG: zinc metallopeptidase [Bacillota bacterium]|nr:zinc metallopeptidase [Bacillota bacterium]
MPRYFYMDWTYMLLIVLGLLAMLAQFNVKSTFAKYRRVQAQSGMTGAEAARQMLDKAGLYDVRVMSIGGMLSDHYNPSDRTVCLSRDVHDGRSIASISVACHECGHAIQHSKNYAPLALRTMFFPTANIGSSLGIPLFIAGLFFNLGFLTTLGIVLFSFAVAFQVITLPVEFDASRRALVQMNQHGFLSDAEQKPARKVLGAAALTYVAATAVAIANLIRLIVMSRRRD